MHRSNLNSVDVVIPWVDGGDPLHSAKLARHLGRKAHKPPRAAQATRYADRGELEFCVSSILRFAPWIRNIFLVTDNQLPDFLPTDYNNLTGGRIRVVDHREIFRGYEDLLPTFNSLSIETMIWRIPGLAEKFIYFNDDLFLINPVGVNDFFSEDHVVLRGEFSPILKPSLTKRIKAFLGLARSTHGAAQSKGASLASPSEDRFLMTGHLPQPLRRSTLEAFFLENEGVLVANAQHKFRHVTQFWPIALAHQLESLINNAEYAVDGQNVYLSPNEMTDEAMVDALTKASTDQSKLFMCMQSLDRCDIVFFQFWTDWMRDRLGTFDDNLSNFVQGVYCVEGKND